MAGRGLRLDARHCARATAAYTGPMNAAARPPASPPAAQASHALSAPLAQLLSHSADAVAAVRAGRSLTDALAQCPAHLRPGVQALSFHALRHWAGATAVLALMAPKPPPVAIHAMLVTAIALLWPGSDPPYAEHTLVDQAVTCVRQRSPAAANFANAVLRRFVREHAVLVATACRQPEAAYQHPAWWIERLRQDWPSQWQALLLAANQRPPMLLRVNARRGTAAAYVQRLAQVGRAATLLSAPGTPQAVWLHQPCGVTELPGFDQGDVSVQDVSAQLAAPLLLGLGKGGADGLDGRAGAALAQGARVLDACAAPGGKTAHLLELADLDLLALDSDGQRLQRVADTLQRLQLKATLQCADARDVPRWWDGRPFDAILIDAPCTGSGIVRRHPDVRWLRRPDDVSALGRTQAALLDALWPLLKPGGRLVYAVCSIFKAEGQGQIDAFLQRHAADKPLLDAASPGHLPGLPDNDASPDKSATGDGFFYALIRKP